MGIQKLAKLHIEGLLHVLGKETRRDKTKGSRGERVTGGNLGRVPCPTAEVT